MTVGRGDTDGSLKVVRKKKIGSSAGVPYENIFDVRESFFINIKKNDVCSDITAVRMHISCTVFIF